MPFLVRRDTQRARCADPPRPEQRILARRLRRRRGQQGAARSGSRNRLRPGRRGEGETSAGLPAGRPARASAARVPSRNPALVLPGELWLLLMATSLGVRLRRCLSPELAARDQAQGSVVSGLCCAGSVALGMETSRTGAAVQRRPARESGKTADSAVCGPRAQPNDAPARVALAEPCGRSLRLSLGRAGSPGVGSRRKVAVRIGTSQAALLGISVRMKSLMVSHAGTR